MTIGGVKMTTDECKEFLEDSEILLDVCEKYMVNSEHINEFIDCYIKGYAADGKDWAFDFAEVQGIDDFEIERIELNGNEFHVAFNFCCGLTVWRGRNQLAKVTADAEGGCVIKNDETINATAQDWENSTDMEKIVDSIKITKLECVQEYYDDTSFLQEAWKGE